MPYAFVAHAELDPASTGQNQEMLRERLIPFMTSQPGFVRGQWLRSADGKSGIGTAVFDTEQNAKAASEAAAEQRPAEAPPVVSSGIYEVMAEA